MFPKVPLELAATPGWGRERARHWRRRHRNIPPAVEDVESPDATPRNRRIGAQALRSALLLRGRWLRGPCLEKLLGPDLGHNQNQGCGTGLAREVVATMNRDSD